MVLACRRSAAEQSYILHAYSVWHCAGTDFTTASQPIAGKPAPTGTAIHSWGLGEQRLLAGFYARIQGQRGGPFNAAGFM